MLILISWHLPCKWVIVWQVNSQLLAVHYTVIPPYLHAPECITEYHSHYRLLLRTGLKFTFTSSYFLYWYVSFTHKPCSISFEILHISLALIKHSKFCKLLLFQWAVQEIPYQLGQLLCSLYLFIFVCTPRINNVMSFYMLARRKFHCLWKLGWRCAYGYVFCY